MGVHIHNPRTVIVLGQSNAAGLGDSNEASATAAATNARVQIHADGYIAPGVAGQWLDLQTGLGSSAPYSGLELTLGADLAAAWGRCHVIKYTGVGDLPTGWASGHTHYANAMTSIAAARAAHVPMELAGIVWMQGESDSENATYAADYETNLRQWITDVRGVFGPLPIAVGRISNSTVWTYGADVRAGQDAVDADAIGGVADVGVFTTDDLPRAVDDAHYTMAGLETLGSRFAAELLALRGES